MKRARPSQAPGLPGKPSAAADVRRVPQSAALESSESSALTSEDLDGQLQRAELLGHRPLADSVPVTEDAPPEATVARAADAKASTLEAGKEPGKGIQLGEYLLRRRNGKF